MRTLLVEDDPVTRRFLERSLGAAGCEVTAFDNAADGLAAYEAEPFPIALLDWMLPGELDGLDLCRHIRQHPGGNRTAVLVLTARDEAGDLDAVLDAGADDYLAKPVTPAALRVRLRIAEARIEALTARDAAQQAADHHRARLHEVLSNAPLILFMLNKNGVFTLVDGRGLGAIGMASEALLGSSIFDRFTDAPLLLDHMRRALAGAVAHTPIEIRGAVFEAYYAPLRTEAGDIDGAIGVFTDVEARKSYLWDLVKDALEEGEERFRRFAEAAFEGIVVIRRQRVVDANQQFATLVGYNLSEVLGRRALEFVAPEARRLASDFIAAAQDEPVELTGLRRGGSRFIIQTRSRPIPSQDDEMFVLAVRDVTAERRAEKERVQLAAQVRQAQKLESLGILAGGIAHDFNNILMGVLGNANLALMDMPEDSPLRDYVEQIDRSAQRAAELTNQMLAYSGKGNFVIEPIDLNAFFEEARDLLEATVDRGRLRYELDGAVPMVEGDRGQIRQAILNLVSNAADALEGRDGWVSIQTGHLDATKEILADSYLVENLPEGPYAYIAVQDTGCGMDSATVARIFDPFFTTKFTGRGLGLAAVLGIVRGHNGTIRVASEPDVGTTVTVLVPASKRCVVQADASDGTGLASERSVVLIVDDEEPVRVVTSRMLERSGYAVLTAANGEEGLALFRRHEAEVGVILLDLTMPVMTGDEVLQELQASAPSARVVLMSGYHEREATLGLDQGLAGFIQKPFSKAVLLEAIEAALGDEVPAGART